MKKTLFLAFLFANFGASAQMTGAIRKNFTDAFVQSCYNTQRSAGVNNSVGNETLAKFCRCNAIYLADSMNNALVASIEKGENRMSPELIQLAETFCRKNLSKY